MPVFIYMRRNSFFLVSAADHHIRALLRGNNLWIYILQCSLMRLHSVQYSLCHHSSLKHRYISCQQLRTYWLQLQNDWRQHHMTCKKSLVISLIVDNNYTARKGMMQWRLVSKLSDVRDSSWTTSMLLNRPPVC